MTARHPRYTRPAPVDFARPDRATAFRTWHGIESEDPPYERHNYAALLAMAQQMLATREKRFPALIAQGDMAADAAQRELDTVAAIVADWRWIATGEGEPAHACTLEARQVLLDQSLITIAAIAREREGFSTPLENQAHMVIAMRWHLEPQRQTHLLARLNHESRRRAQPGRQAHAA